MTLRDSLDRMLRFEVRQVIDDAERTAVIGLVTRVQKTSGHRPLSDQAWLELVHGGPTWHAVVLCLGPDDELLGACLIGRATDLGPGAGGRP